MKSKKLYQKYSCGSHWKKHPSSYAQRFAEFLKEKNFTGLVVDIGCGNGRDVEVFAKLGFNVLGIDNSKAQVKMNKKKLSGLNFEVQNAEKLKFENGSVGAFFVINLIHYVDKEKTIKEIFAKLAPQGYCFIHFNMEIMDKNGKVDYRHDSEDILRLVSRFRIIQKTTFQRTDQEPIEHTHKIMELILQKPPLK